MEENQTPKPEEKKAPIGSVVETLAEDMVGALNAESGGLIKKIIATEEARDKEKTILSPESTQNKIYMGIGIVLILLSSGIIAYLFTQKKVAEISMETPIAPMIFIDKSEFMAIDDLDKDHLEELVKNETKNSEVKDGGIEGIYLTLSKNIVGLGKFLNLTKSSLPITESDTFSENFLVGVYKNESPHLFFLIKVKSFADVLHDLRGWEKKMYLDLHDFFGSTLSANTEYLLTKNFEDGFVENKNARILKDAMGKPVLLYAFPDDTHLVIADDTSAVREVIFRLAGNKLPQ